jgi:hypothetical protein
MRRPFFPLLLAAWLCAPPVFAQAPTVRPEVGKPLQAAVDLLKARRAKEALAQAREAQAQSDKTPYESYLARPPPRRAIRPPLPRRWRARRDPRPRHQPIARRSSPRLRRSTTR